MYDNMESIFSAEELMAIQAICLRESIRQSESDRAILGSDYFFVSAEKLA